MPQGAHVSGYPRQGSRLRGGAGELGAAHPFQTPSQQPPASPRPQLPTVCVGGAGSRCSVVGSSPSCAGSQVCASCKTVPKHWDLLGVKGL